MFAAIDDSANDVTSLRFHESVKGTKKNRIPLNKFKACPASCNCDDELCPNFYKRRTCPPSCKNCENNFFRRASNVPVEIRYCGAKGHGLFTLANIKEDTFVIAFLSDVITKEEEERRRKIYQDENKHCYFFGTGAYTLDATVYGNKAKFVNHSCSPNMIVEQWLVHGAPTDFKALAFVSSRDINAGEELTITYGDDYSTVMKCLCNANNCAGIVGQKPIDPRLVRKAQREAEAEEKRKKPVKKRAARRTVVIEPEIVEDTQPADAGERKEPLIEERDLDDEPELEVADAMEPVDAEGPEEPLIEESDSENEDDKEPELEVAGDMEQADAGASEEPLVGEGDSEESDDEEPESEIVGDAKPVDAGEPEEPLIEEGNFEELDDNQPELEIVKHLDPASGAPEDSLIDEGDLAEEPELDAAVDTEPAKAREIEEPLVKEGDLEEKPELEVSDVMESADAGAPKEPMLQGDDSEKSDDKKAESEVVESMNSEDAEASERVAPEINTSHLRDDIAEPANAEEHDELRMEEDAFPEHQEASDSKEPESEIVEEMESVAGVHEEPLIKEGDSEEPDSKEPESEIVKEMEPVAGAHEEPLVEKGELEKEPEVEVADGMKPVDAAAPEELLIIEGDSEKSDDEDTESEIVEEMEPADDGAPEEQMIEEGNLEEEPELEVTDGMEPVDVGAAEEPLIEEGDSKKSDDKEAESEIVEEMEPVGVEASEEPLIEKGDLEKEPELKVPDVIEPVDAAAPEEPLIKESDLKESNDEEPESEITKNEAMMTADEGDEVRFGEDNSTPGESSEDSFGAGNEDFAGSDEAASAISEQRSVSVVHASSAISSDYTTQLDTVGDPLEALEEPPELKNQTMNALVRVDEELEDLPDNSEPRIAPAMDMDYGDDMDFGEAPEEDEDTDGRATTLEEAAVEPEDVIDSSEDKQVNPGNPATMALTTETSDPGEDTEDINHQEADTTHTEGVQDIEAFQIPTTSSERPKRASRSMRHVTKATVARTTETMEASEDSEDINRQEVLDPEPAIAERPKRASRPPREFYYQASEAVSRPRKRKPRSSSSKAPNAKKPALCFHQPPPFIPEPEFVPNAKDIEEKMREVFDHCERTEVTEAEIAQFEANMSNKKWDYSTKSKESRHMWVTISNGVSLEPEFAKIEEERQKKRLERRRERWQRHGDRFL